MELLATIEPDAGAAAHLDEWIALVGTHSSLAPVQPRQSINPITKEAHVYKAARGYAGVLLDGTIMGAIHWAMDDSHRLVVWSSPTARTHVIVIAREWPLGWAGDFFLAQMPNARIVRSRF